MRKDFNIHLTDEMAKTVEAFIKQSYKEYFEQFPNARGAEQGIPAQGATGGGITYQITPTSIGDILTVQVQVGRYFERSLLLDDDHAGL